jgi:hypothetical protein
VSGCAAIGRRNASAGVVERAGVRSGGDATVRTAVVRVNGGTANGAGIASGGSGPARSTNGREPGIAAVPGSVACAALPDGATSRTGSIEGSASAACSAARSFAGAARDVTPTDDSAATGGSAAAEDAGGTGRETGAAAVAVTAGT